MSTDKKADFSDVSAKVTSTEQIVEKADFSDVTARVESTEEIVGQQTYTIEKGDTLSKIVLQFSDIICLSRKLHLPFLNLKYLRRKRKLSTKIKRSFCVLQAHWISPVACPACIVTAP